MKRNQPIAGIVLLLVAFPLMAENAIEDDIELPFGQSYDVYTGVSYKQNWIPAKPQWDQLLVNTQPGFDVYFGWRFHSHFAGEFGYEWTANKPLSTVVNPNGSLLGATNNSNSAVTLTGKVRFKTGHADLNAFVPFSVASLGWEIAPEWILSVGIGGTKPSIKINGGPLNDTTEPYISQFSSIQGRSKAMLRAGLGVQSIIIEDVGLRAIWRYENASVLRARGTEFSQNTATEQMFRNGQSITIGLFVKF